MFLHRIDAARRLAVVLSSYTKKKDVCILGLTRGGVVLAQELSRLLHIPFDCLIVRKIGAPGNPEFAIGAISEGGAVEINNEVVQNYGISWEYIDQQIVLETKKIEQRKTFYRDKRPLLDVAHHTVIIVDDGLATGYTMRVAIQDIKKRGALKIVAAVPVGPMDTVHALQKIADAVVCLETPDMFFAVGSHYIDFSQVSDEEVIVLLKQLEKIKKTV